MTALVVHVESNREAGSAGPDGAWTEQWARHRDDIVSYAVRLLHGDVHAAEDVAQETAVRFWRHAASFEHEGALLPWLRTVTRNIVIDRVRRRAVRPVEVSLVDATPLGDLADDPVRHLEATVTVDALLAPLTDAHRDAVREVYVHDLGIVGAARRLDLPVGTVKSRCHYALKVLRSVVHERRSVPWSLADRQAG